MKFISLNSRAIAPKTRVPFGFPSWSMTTVIISYYHTVVTFEFFTCTYNYSSSYFCLIFLEAFILGTASLITATITSPIWAYQWLPAPKIRIHINSIAPLRCYPLHSKGSEWDGSWKSGFWLDSDLAHEWLIFAGREWPWKGVLMSICSIEKIGRWKTDPLWFE